MRILHVGFGFKPLRGGGLIEYVDDLMESQIHLGHYVAYFCSGRQYPIINKPWLKQWVRGAVEIFEIINSPIVHLGELGTFPKESELREHTSESFYSDVLKCFRPDVIHFHELAGLPSSIVEIAANLNIPTVYTIHDYYLLCPTIKLYRYDKSICHDKDPSRSCCVCCKVEINARKILCRRTLGYHLERCMQQWPVLNSAISKAKFFFSDRNALKINSNVQVDANAVFYFKQRRELQSHVFSLFDRVVSQSEGAKKVFESLTGRNDIMVIHSSLRHIANINCSKFIEIPSKIKFVTLNGFASHEKGADVLIEAIEILIQNGFADTFSIHAYGTVAPQYINKLSVFDSVKIMGAYSSLRLDSLLEGYHVGILPSVWDEIYGYVGIEMIAKGIPVIGNKKGGITDYVLNGISGWVNEDATPNGLAEIMARVIKKPYEILLLNDSINKRRKEMINSFDHYSASLMEVYYTLFKS